MIYLDNSATSYPKPKCVINSVKRCLIKCGGNAGRSGHSLSTKTAESIFRARETVANHIRYDHPERVVFTQNATHSLNLAIKGLITSPCHVIISNLEHNSVLRPIISLSKRFEVEYSVFNALGNYAEEIPKLIQVNTKYIICTVVSNVSGKEIDINFLSEKNVGNCFT